MAQFEPAYLLVADVEGGYQDHPSDNGNYNSLGQLVGTNLGISAPVYENWINRPPTREDMQSITPSIAKSIYKQRYWDVILGDQIQSQAVANILFDGRVNHGSTGVRLIQQVLGVGVDGVVGPITMAAINNSNPNKLVADYKEARRQFYHQLVNNNPNYQVFLQGWLNRLSQFSTSPAGVLGGVGSIVGLVALFLIFSK